MANKFTFNGEDYTLTRKQYKGYTYQSKSGKQVTVKGKYYSHVKDSKGKTTVRYRYKSNKDANKREALSRLALKNLRKEAKQVQEKAKKEKEKPIYLIAMEWMIRVVTKKRSRSPDNLATIRIWVYTRNPEHYSDQDFQRYRDEVIQREAPPLESALESGTTEMEITQGYKEEEVESFRGSLDTIHWAIEIYDYRYEESGKPSWQKGGRL